MVKAGELRNTITIVTPVKVDDGARGKKITGYTSGAVIPASVEPMGEDKLYRAMQVGSKDTLKVRIRVRDDIVVGTLFTYDGHTTKYRVTKVVRPKNDNTRSGAELQLICEEAGV